MKKDNALETIKTRIMTTLNFTKTEFDICTYKMMNLFNEWADKKYGEDLRPQNYSMAEVQQFAVFVAKNLLDESNYNLDEFDTVNIEAVKTSPASTFKRRVSLAERTGMEKMLKLQRESIKTD